MTMNDSGISVVIPTYRREEVLLQTIGHVLQLQPPPAEIIVVDQTEEHAVSTAAALKALSTEGKIRLISLSKPSITHAMNVGLLEAKEDVVLFLDDDVVPDKALAAAHLNAHAEGCNIIAGRVLQPGDEPAADDYSGVFRFCSNQRRFVDEFVGCNFSVKRKTTLALGGFDENFVHVAYRYEAEFADRALSSGEKILFEPAAGIHHLKVSGGGTRSFGDHLRTVRPSHSVGEYYYLMRSGRAAHRLAKMAVRPLRAVRTRHHLHNPWWIPLTLAAELLGLIWAVVLFLKGPKYIIPAGGTK